MDITSGKIKFRKDEDINQQIKDKRFNLTCEDVVDIFKDIITMKFGKEEVQSFEFFKSSQQHLRINDLKTGTNFTASCHSRSGQPGRYNPSEINTLLRMLTESIRHRENELMQKKSNNQKWVKIAKWSKVDSEEIHPDLEREVEAAKKRKKTKNHGGLDDWFKKEKWVDVSRPKKDGGFEACGRGDTATGKKPVCTPANKAKNLTDKERKNRIRQKRQKEKEPNPDKKPNVTKYSPGAGGKSNVSDNHNIRFVSSMIPLSELAPQQPKFITIEDLDT